MVKISMTDLDQLQEKLPQRITRRHSPKTELESCVVKQAVDSARRNGWYVERRNTGASTGDKSFMRYGTPGGADLIVVVSVGGRPIHIEAEAKRPDGGRQSTKQKEFEERCKSHGIPYFIFTSSIEFEENVKNIIYSMD
ncbi:MAG: hypothetical protein WCW93_03845, partial [Candidatus Paceibacterota bacterium]